MIKTHQNYEFTFYDWAVKYTYTLGMEKDAGYRT
jgi:hypothetical protein